METITDREYEWYLKCEFLLLALRKRIDAELVEATGDRRALLEDLQHLAEEENDK